MPCPHFSIEVGECLLQEEPGDEEERGSDVLDDTVRQEWCLSPDKGHRSCPVFVRYLAELTP